MPMHDRGKWTKEQEDFQQVLAPLSKVSKISYRLIYFVVTWFDQPKEQ